MLAMRVPPVYVRPLPPEAIRRLSKPSFYGLSASLRLVDITLQRWAVSIGDGLPSEQWDDRPRAKLVPLNDEHAIAVDRLILSAPEHVVEIVRLWYKTPIPISVIAKRLRIEHREAVSRWKASLEWAGPRLAAINVLSSWPTKEPNA